LESTTAEILLNDQAQQRKSGNYREIESNFHQADNHQSRPGNELLDAGCEIAQECAARFGSIRPLRSAFQLRDRNQAQGQDSDQGSKDVDGQDNPDGKGFQKQCHQGAENTF
jgi:hypothetical protein